MSHAYLEPKLSIFCRNFIAIFIRYRAVQSDSRRKGRTQWSVTLNAKSNCSLLLNVTTDVLADILLHRSSSLNFSTWNSSNSVRRLYSPVYSTPCIHSKAIRNINHPNRSLFLMTFFSGIHTFAFQPDLPVCDGYIVYGCAIRRVVAHNVVTTSWRRSHTVLITVTSHCTSPWNGRNDFGLPILIALIRLKESWKTCRWSSLNEIQ